MKPESKSWGQLVEEIERPVYYAVLIAYFLVALVAQVRPGTWKWLDAVQAVLFPAVLLIVFRYFDSLARKPADVKEYGQELGMAISATIKRGSHVERLDILACTGVKYQVLLKDMGVRANEVHLLQPSSQALNQSPFMTPEIRAALVAEQARTNENWQALVRDGRIQRLFLEEIPFTPLVHCMLANRSAVAFGFFEPLPGGSGMRTMEKFAVSNTSATGRALIEDIAQHLDALRRCAVTRSYTQVALQDELGSALSAGSTREV
jgi:hypothetical protein